MAYFTMYQIRDENQEWFSPSTMEFFDSKIEPGVWPVDGGAYFVTSEQQSWPYHGGEREPRRWSVRFARDGGNDIRTVGTFMAYPTLGEALDMAYQVAGMPGHHPIDPALLP